MIDMHHLTTTASNWELDVHYGSKVKMCFIIIIHYSKIVFFIKIAVVC